MSFAWMRSRGHHSLGWVLIAAGVVAVAAAAGLWGSTFPGSPLPPKVHGAGIGLANGTTFGASDSHNGTGGCSAPPTGATEYCDEFKVVPRTDLVPPVGSGSSTGTASSSVINVTSNNVTFELANPAGDALNLTFVNVTLISPGGALLASYAVGSGWSPYTTQTLPVAFAVNQTIVLNLGVHAPAAGDVLLLEEEAWGSASVVLP